MCIKLLYINDEKYTRSSSSVEVILKKRDVLVFESKNPGESKNEENFSKHFLGACFKPYNNLLSLQTCLNL